MTAPGTNILVALLLEVAISPASNGRERTAANHVSVIKWTRENGCVWDHWTCNTAAQYGHRSCLQWARENGCDWNETSCQAAARGGHLSCLQWARENGCPWNKYTCEYAAEGGHISCLQWARENGCMVSLCMLLLMLVIMVISPASNGRERTDYQSTILKAKASEGEL